MYLIDATKGLAQSLQVLIKMRREVVSFTITTLRTPVCVASDDQG